MTFTQLRNITVFVSDQDQAKSFYVDVLGFSVRTDAVMGENRWLEVAPGDSGTAIVVHKAFPGASVGSSRGVIVESNSLDADVAAVREAGGKVDGPEEMPWGRQAIVSDPDGNSFVLAEAN